MRVRPASSRLAGLLLLPLWQQLVAGLRRHRRRRRGIARTATGSPQQLVEPPGLAVPGDDLGFGPVGVVAGGTVAGVADIEDQGGGPLRSRSTCCGSWPPRSTPERYSSRPSAETRNTTEPCPPAVEGFLSTPTHDENRVSGCGCG